MRQSVRNDLRIQKSGSITDYFFIEVAVMPKVSFVIPAYNDASQIRSLIDELELVSSTQNYQAEIVIVDDGSEEEVWKELTRIQKASALPISLIRLSHNHGQHVATLCGIALRMHKDGVVVTMDSDLQHPPSSVPGLIAKIGAQGADLVYGYGNSGHSVIRRMGSLVVRSLIGAPGGGVFLRCSSFRVLSQELVNLLISSINEKAISIDDRLRKLNPEHRVVSIPHQKRKSGKSSYSLSDKIIVPLEMMYHSVQLLKGAITLSSPFLFLGILSWFTNWTSKNAALMLVAIPLLLILSSLVITLSRKKMPFMEQVSIKEVIRNNARN